MKLLITTQALDLDDPVLSAYHGWVAGLAAHAKTVQVICLKEGRHELPTNVTVHTLGKEAGKQSTLTYALRFLRLAWKLRREYDTAFVHMNEEYLLIAGALWRILGKRVYMWRNHYAGSWKTDVAAFWCNAVFCTSKHSYTAKYKKTKLMPVGVDTTRFSASTAAVSRSILFFSRISPSKRPELFLDALTILKQEGVAFTASVVGSPLPEYEAYHRMLQAKAKAQGIGEQVTFMPGVPNDEAPSVFARHEYFVNCSPSGMFDKTLFEAAASGCIVLASGEDYKELAGETFWFADAAMLAKRLKTLLENGIAPEDRATLREIAKANSFDKLMGELTLTLIA